MPELPDVEAIKQSIAPQILGHRFSGVTLHWPRAVCCPSPEEFCSRLVGQTIEELARRGKYLILRLSGGEVLIIHLRMSGSLDVKTKFGAPDRFARTVFHFEGGTQLTFSDQRKLGMMWLVPDENTVVGKLGPEPLDAGFTLEVLAQRLKRHNGPIKPLLYDQSFVAGIGNIYADEILFEAGIHPLSKANELSEQEVARLHRAIRQVLPRATRRLGLSLNEYRVPFGELEANQWLLRLPRFAGEPCPLCATPIERIPIRKRGTYFCPNCQRPS